MTRAATFPAHSFVGIAPAKRVSRPAPVSAQADSGQPDAAWLPLQVRRNLGQRALRLMRSGD